MNKIRHLLEERNQYKNLMSKIRIINIRFKQKFKASILHIVFRYIFIDRKWSKKPYAQ